MGEVAWRTSPDDELAKVDRRLLSLVDKANSFGDVHRDSEGACEVVGCAKRKNSHRYLTISDLVSNAAYSAVASCRDDKVPRAL